MTRIRLVPAGYRRLLALPAARRALLGGVLLRLPGAAMFPTLTLLCVTGHGTSYAAAGVAGAAYTISAAMTGPVIGRLVDARGVRWVGTRLLPINLGVWATIGHAPYVGVVALAAVAGATCLPFWGISRQLVLYAAPEQDRTTALSLDSVGTELAYIVGPAAGIGLATTWNPQAAVTITGLAISTGVAALAATNPTFHAPPRAGEDPAPACEARRSPLRLPGMAPLLGLSVIVATTLVGTDLLLLAKLRETHQTGAYAAVAAVWAGGSMVGGLVYGARPPSWSAGTLTTLLALLTATIAVAHTPVQLAAAGFVAGLGCAPVMTAITADITRITPARQHTEALGWYSSAHTTGATVGSTGVGALIDTLGPLLATLTTTLGGAAIATLLTMTTRTPTTTPAPDHDDDHDHGDANGSSS